MNKGLSFTKLAGKGQSVQSKLTIAFVVIALIPLCLFSWLSFKRINNTLEQHAQTELQQVTNIAQQFSRFWLADYIKDFKLLKNQLTTNSVQQQSAITEFVNVYEFVNNVELIDSAALLATPTSSFISKIAPQSLTNIHTSLSEHATPSFQSFLIEKQPHFIIALGIYNTEQQLSRILLADINPQWLMNQLNAMYTKNSELSFSLLPSNSLPLLNQQPSTEQTLLNKTQLMQKTFTYNNENNDVMYGFVSQLNFLGDQSWLLLVSKPNVQGLTNTYSIKYFALATLLMLLAVLACSWWFGRVLFHPLRRLTALVDKITKGKSTQVPILPDSQEFNLLSSKLCKLAENKQQQLTEFYKQGTELQVVLRHLAEQKSALDEHAIVAATDLKGTITFVNKKFCEISGYDEHELIGKNHRILNSGTHPKQFFKEMYQTLKQGKVWHGKICNKAKQGNLYWVDTTIAPFLDENAKPQSYIAIRTDLTALKLQEIELEEHKAQLQLVIDTTAVGIWDWYIDTGKVTFNHRWAEIIGYTLDELGPAVIGTWYKYAHPDDLIVSEQKLNAHFSGETNYYVNEARMKHKQGHWVWILDTAKVVEWNDDGSPKRMIGTHLDITEQKATELELQNSRDQFASLVGNIPGIIYRCKYDKVWTMLYMSKQTKELTGYDAEAILENKQLSYLEIIYSDDRDDIEKTIIKCIDEHTPWSVEYRIITQGNEVRWVNEKGQAIYDTDGNVLYLDGFILDITERYQAQLKITRQQSLLESMSKQGQIGAWEIDLKAQTLYWSDEVRAIHEVPQSYSPDIATAINHYKEGYHRDKINALFESAISSGKSWNIELIIVTYTGQERWVKSIGQSEFENGQCIRVFGSFQSIDAHKRLELESEKANRYNKSLAMLTVAPEVQSSDVAEVKKLAVKSMCEVLDVQRASIWIFNEQRDLMICHSLNIQGQGVDCCNAQLSAEDYPAYYEAIYKQNLIAIDDVYNHPATVDFIEHYAKPNNIKSMLDAVITTGDGNLGILCAETVGEFRQWTQSEETYLRSLATLVGSTLVSQRRKQTAEELKIALVLAKEAGVAKSQFLATMSHEIRTPMNGVLGMLELIQLEQLPKPIETKVAIAKTSAQSLLGVINDILDFSKVEAGKIELESINFNARDLIGEVAAGQALTAQNKGIEIILDLVALEPSQLSGDPGRIRQVLTNLLSNAVKFTNEGEVVVSASIERIEAQLMLQVSVKDSGIGISKEKQQQLFAPFMQVDASTTREYGGTGLGLAISKQLCELMGGAIAIKSNAGQGSEFIVTMEVLKGDQQERYMPKANINGLSILVVDDNETNRLVISEQLKHWGANVELANNAEHALLICENRVKNNQGMYDIAVLDMQMPGMDGIELCEVLKAHADYKHMPLVMMTSIAGLEGAQRYSDAGFQAYFPKPVTTADLISALSVITNSEQHEALPLVTSGYISSLRKAKTIEPAKILLVEDNPINQQVSTLMLKKLNCETVLAENGQRALEELAKHEAGYFQVVLMDCQMPVMDGYDATIAIRKGEAGEQHKAIKIIALTANAMDSDKERCIAAGMNDYLSKPIELDILKDKLEQYF